MPCRCRRCECLADCLSVVFVEQHGFDEDTTMDLCTTCYDLYSRLYITHLEGDEEFDETPMEHDEDPCDPVISMTQIEADDPR